MEEVVNAAKKLAYDESTATGMPLKKHIDLGSLVGKRIAKQLNANVQIVEAGTYLMDCVIGQALKAGKLPEHVVMSEKKTSELLAQFNISEKDKENIKACVREHHGVEKFYSLESEICCNADCYRFVSVKGFSYAMRYLRDMPFPDLVALLNKKTEEKWKALTLKLCKDELTPEYEALHKMLGVLNTEAVNELD